MNQGELIQNMNKYWKDNEIFAKSISQRSDKLQSITYDGPPFASGTPHFGHGLISSMKDLVLRYKTMKGYKVNRDRGWDCHGLPVEKAVEKVLGIDGKRDIEEKIGVEKFVEECRNYVSNTSDEWRIFVDQIGRRADMDHAYYTMDLGFMESVIRVFQNMYNQNLVYKGFKVQRFCPSCATSLSNSEVNEGYQDRQDPAITIKFQINNKTTNTEHEVTPDGFTQVVCCAVKKDNKIFMLYHKKGQKYVFPGGKIDTGYSLEDTVKKELKEEIGVEATSMNNLGSFKEIMPYGLYNLHIIDVEYKGEPENLEPAKHTHAVRAEVIDSDNKLGFAIRIDETVIDDEYEIIHQFYDIYIYHNKIAQKITETQAYGPANVNVLAWTTTPWTLPSNMFLAVGKHIEYVMLFDLSSKEYYIVAEALIKQFYKDQNEYLIVNKFKGEHLLGVQYEAILPYINQSKISDDYKKEYFKIIAGEFVSTEDGTGIVHIAPAFGIDDFDAVAAFLPKEDAKNWLFLPVNDFGEFTDEVPEYKGIRVYEANKDIIQRLKDEKKLIGQKSYNHSYPHCWRCDTPLISKALTSWFIKEQELSSITLPNAEKIGFVPESIKNRFRDTLASAPDWNLARNRYRGSPIPIRENVNKPEERIVIGTLEELFQQSKTGSKNITKNIIIRHAESEYNPTNLHDSYGNIKLSENGFKQVTDLTKKLKEIENEDIIVVVSPLSRSLETIKPFLSKFIKTEELKTLETEYKSAQKKYQELRDNQKLQEYIQDSKEKKLFKLHDKVYIDFRITDIIVPEIQNQEFPHHLTLSKPTNEKLTPTGESMDNIFARNKDYIESINSKFPTQTIITITHKDSAISMQKAFKDFDFLTKKQDHSQKNAQINTLYRDNSRNTQVDLHKPHIDNYWFTKKGNEYRRIPEIMDCRFESGSMPFGQANYIGKDKNKFIYPADFIMEGLDQTRGRFRGMHVVGNAVMKKNSFNNVVINGMVLAEDGKKMSKKLNNYPDPAYLFSRYGSDAYRLYLLSSPAVRAEPVRFSEKGVDQVYKDFTSAITNGYNFFETYANVDKFQYNNPIVHFIRHGKADGQANDSELTTEAFKDMKTEKFISDILRISPDIIYTSPLQRTAQTGERIKDIILEYTSKEVQIVSHNGLAEEKNIIETYHSILEENKGKNILIVSHEPQFQNIWSKYYNETKGKTTIDKLEIVKMPTYQIVNELDKWILAELNQLGINLETYMDKYQLDNGTKELLGFIDKLNNRYIRRSRRRFRASGMDDDKLSAYNTMFEVLEIYMKICAPFAPFISEHIYLQLQKFKPNEENNISVHLAHLPLFSIRYVNPDLLNEISFVRRIISLGLFIRSKNKIAVKQPLQKIQLKVD